VSEGKSTYSIIVPAVAAQSVNDAAVEMQRDITEATGAKLSIVKDNEIIKGAFISLGSTKQAREANISASGIPDEGFRIVTRNDNLYIIGPDTTTVNLNRGSGDEEKTQLHPEIPGPAFTKDGGYSRGTANGVYTFLENQLGVRWLFPGDLGRDVPPRKTFRLAEMDRTQAPEFIYRVITPFQQTAAVTQWRDHQRLGFSFRLNHNHSWVQMVPPSMYEKHPDWFAMDSKGERIKPATGNQHYKLESTNRELIEYFAEKAVEAFKVHPELNTFSLSPSDGSGWSQSPQSEKFFDPAPAGRFSQSLTRLILKWYRDICAIVAKEYPQGKLAGYFYGAYALPPQDGDMQLPDNFIPVIPSLASGYSMYLPERREADAALLKGWSRVAPEKWFYYAYPDWLRFDASMALITPAAPDNINFMFGNLVRYHIRGAFLYGNSDWSESALKNYILAQMLWNPRADAKALQHDWLMRAYGPAAGAIMEEFYNKMDAHWFSDSFRVGSAQSGVDELMIRSIYGAHYPQMEELFLKAWNQPMTAKQKSRLGLIRENMIVLQWRLRNAGYLPAEYPSPLKADTSRTLQLITAQDVDFTHFRDAIFDRVQIKKGVMTSLAPSLAEKPKMQTTSIPNSSSILLFPTQASEIILHPTEVHPGSTILTYYVQDNTGKTYCRGILSDDSNIVFKAQANTPYYLTVIKRGVFRPTGIKWKIFVPHGVVTSKAIHKDNVVTLYPPDNHLPAPLYVYMADSLSLQTQPDAAGITIVLSPAAATAMAARDMGKEAQVALEEAQKRYRASVVENLDTQWKFTTDPEKMGGAKGYFKSEFDDSSWKTINSIGYWQDQGFPDYHGTAWYRKTFVMFKAGDDPLVLGNRKLLLFFGAIDGDATFYLNDQKIGEHSLREHMQGWEIPVVLDVTNVLSKDENTLAVKVTKDRFASGIYRGVSILAGVLKEDK
jgi:hypothetical protein